MKAGTFQPVMREGLPKMASWAGLLVALLGCVTILTWILNPRTLPPYLVNETSIDPVLSLTLILAGIALWRLAKPPADPKAPADKLAFALATIVTLVGLLGVAGQIWPALHPSLWLQSKVIGLPLFNEMSTPASLGLLLCGLGLALLNTETPRGFRPAQVFILPAALVALLALICYSYRLLWLFRIDSETPMPLAAALGFTLLSAGMLAARPNRGAMMVITSATSGGAMARRLLPMAILLPWILGALRLLGEQAGYFQSQFGISSFAVSTIVVFTILIWWNAKLLYLADRERERVERRLAVQYRATRVLAEAGDLGPAMRSILGAVCETLGWQAGAMWKIGPRKNHIRCLEVWHVDKPNLEPFIEATRKRALKPGEGLPGRVWSTGEPAWIQDVDRDDNFPRARAAREAGLHGAFGFPVRSGKEICGVMEFFSREIEPPDSALLQMVAALGAQIGQFIERHRAQEELREMAANLERSNTDLQQFAYVASHDLSEPLRMVSSYLQLLSSDYKDQIDSQGQEFISFAAEGAKRMQELIKDLLAYSQVESRGRPFEPVDCMKILRDVTSNLMVAIEESSAAIHYDALPRVLGDRVQLAQVFQNLVGNAIKFHGKEPPRVHVGAEHQNHDWVFFVRDNGIGIEPKDFERIFVIFQRLHTRQEYPGTGMGLAICKRIIERHGGRIWLEANPDKGSTFFFTLPALEEEKPNHKKEEPAAALTA